MRIAAVQMNSTPDLPENLSQAHELLRQAVDRGADLVAFPENFSIFAKTADEIFAVAETLRGPTVQTLQEWAAEYEVWILGGTLPLKVAGKPRKVTNTSLLISPDGEITARYDKMHLFDAALAKDQPYQESKYVQPGKKVVTATLPLGKAGLSVCYDLRFPELYRRQSAQGARVLFAPSAFTLTTGQAHWDVLTRARAIENQCYLIAPAQTGSPYAGRQTYGHTRIVDPWGRTLAERPSGVGVVWADLQEERLETIRRELPALKHRRLKA